jgi:penicillin-binding protein 1C
MAFGGLAIPAAWGAYARALGPLDLSAAGQGSVIAVDRSGHLLRAFTTADGRWRLPIALGDVDPRFIAMLTAYEDHRFFAHPGVDALALARAAGQWIGHGHIVSGGSTLTMQIARLLEPRADRSLAAKLNQILRAREIEGRVAKSGVLELYLALAPYGGNLEGVRAASLAYFGKEPKRLSIAEAALLAALPQSPEARRPDRHPAAARAARDLVLDRVFARGLIGLAEREGAKREPVPTQRRAFPFLAAHASEAALRRDPRRRIHRLTLDARLQSSLERLARENAARLGPNLSAALLVVDNASGEVLAHVGAADYFSRERAGAIDMTEAVRSPGSTLKPFIYALAFENGIAHPETLLDDRPRRYGIYAPENFDLSFQGAVTARRALQLSLNLPAVELLAEIGPARFIARLRNAGADILLPRESAPGLAVGLGGVGVRLRDLAALYCGLARGGAMPVLSETAREAAIARREPLRISEPVASWYVADILRGAPPPLNAPAGRIAFKTGTSYGYRDAFAVGFDKAHTIAVWVGRPDNGAVPGLAGRQVAAPILFDAFARLGGARQFPTAPANALISRTALLPPPLRHLRKDAPKTLAAAAAAQLKIAYPPDGARIDLGLALRPGRSLPPEARLALKAEGGAPPLTWMVNGAPLGAPNWRRQATWTPDGAGFARVSVMDAKGATDSILVRLE